MFVSALAMDPKGLTTLRKATGPAELAFALDRLALPPAGVVTNLAVILPGVSGGSFNATLSLPGGTATAFQIEDGIAMSNLGALNDGDPTTLNRSTPPQAARPTVPRPW